MGLRQAQRDQQLEEIQATIKAQQTEKQLKDLAHQEQLSELRAQAERLGAENALQAQELAVAQTQLQLLQQKNMTNIAEMDNLMKVRDTQDKVKSKVLSDLDYMTEPFQDGTLHVSDRRIALNGPIWTGTADYVTERIHFFNNQSKDYPIFIVIDDCPGGSVMEGYRIVKAMESSPAPVHVVVKSFAASMAAVITTLAEESYAYPNAIILHHQMSSGMRGNLTQQQEQLENGFEWAKRLADPVAEKMGVDYDEFVELMYENNSDGDWEEFADEAVELKWVNNVVHEIRENGIRDQPTSSRGGDFWFWEYKETDEAGNTFIRMPALRPFDHYFIYDPYDFYRH
jgi:ATP-dependent Clp protease protease subunit